MTMTDIPPILDANDHNEMLAHLLARMADLEQRVNALEMLADEKEGRQKAKKAAD